MGVTIGPIGGSDLSKYIDVSPKPQLSSPAAQKIDGALNAPGRKSIAEQAFQKSLQHLVRLFSEKNVQVSNYFDAKSGMQQVTITDADSGKQIAQLPPDAVVDMAERSKQRHIGWIVDLLA